MRGAVGAGPVSDSLRHAHGRDRSGEQVDANRRYQLRAAAVPAKAYLHVATNVPTKKTTRGHSTACVRGSLGGATWNQAVSDVRETKKTLVVCELPGRFKTDRRAVENDNPGADERITIGVHAP